MRLTSFRDGIIEATASFRTSSGNDLIKADKIFSVVGQSFSSIYVHESDMSWKPLPEKPYQLLNPLVKTELPLCPFTIPRYHSRRRPIRDFLRILSAEEL